MGGQEPMELEGENKRFLKGFQHYLDLSMVVPENLLEDVEEISERGRAAFAATEGPEGYGLESKVWDIRPLPQILLNYCAVNVMYMVFMKNVFNRSEELDRTVEEMTAKRLKDAVENEEPADGTTTGRRDIPLLNGKFYLSVVNNDQSPEVQAIRRRHEENMHKKGNDDRERELARQAKM